MSVQAFSPGDPAPWFTCRSSNNAKFHFDAAAGRYLVLSFLGSLASETNAAILAHVTGTLRHLLDDENIAYFAVSTDPSDETPELVSRRLRGIRYFWDFDLRVSTLYGAVDRNPDAASRYRSFTLVLDPGLHVIANIPVADVRAHNETLARVLSALPAMSQLSQQAPVLVLPNVFEPELCRTLIDLYERQGGQDSGFMRESEGNTVGVLDHGFKRRTDCRFDGPEHEELRKLVRARITQKLTPEIKKVFQVGVTRLERYVIACYESESSGFFRAHRDNTTKGTAHRMFACTLNLNAEEYEGGDLRFPEYGRNSYRAPTGSAVVFSCSLLHEALPVTKGRRYAFLPFLYDDAAAKLRAENRKFLTGEWTDKNPEPSPT